jgi:hypothetical protein
MRHILIAAALIGLGAALAGCQPTVRVEGGREPITINLNIKIEQEVRVKIDKDLDELIKSKPGIF